MRKKEFIRKFTVYSKQGLSVHLTEYAIYTDLGKLTKAPSKFIRTQTEYITDNGIHYYPAHGGYEFNGVIFFEKTKP